LNTRVVYTATFGDPFNSTMGGNFITEPIDIVHEYIKKNSCTFRKPDLVVGDRDSIKASIVLKIVYLNERQSEVYDHYVHTEILVLHSHLENYETVFMQCIDTIFAHLKNYNENGSGSVVLFIENLSVNICKFKRFNFKRRGRRGRAKVYSLKI
jgi:hypothetical protein